MKSIFCLWFALFLLPAAAFAQEFIPSGVILPARLDSTLSSKSKPGDEISARIMQDVPLDDRQKIRAGSRLSGHVVSVAPDESSAGTKITFVFDKLISSRRTFPVTVELRALASPRAVNDAQIPTSGSDRAISASAATTMQIGGPMVYRGGGHVVDRGQVVGEPAPDGILGSLRANFLRGCEGPAEGGRPQAFWLFSTNACGVYDLPGVTIVRAQGHVPAHAPDSAADSASPAPIELLSKRRLNISGGSALLLRVIDSDEPTAGLPTR